MSLDISALWAWVSALACLYTGAKEIPSQTHQGAHVSAAQGTFKP